MAWWGKLLGGAFGYMLGGPLGALLGIALGHRLDKGVDGFEGETAEGWSPGEQERVQAAFFTAVFSVMGHLAKADGRVAPDEIRLAEAVMRRMRLTPEMREAAKALFREGKSPGFDLDAVLDQLRRECGRRRNLLRMFLEIQLQAAFADGTLHDAEARILRHVAARLGFSPQELAQMEAMVRAARHFAGDGAGGGAYREPTPAKDRLSEAYAVLGVSPDASDAEVKKAYRRLMNRHHPDKLVARGLPEEMVKMATEKTQEIKAAYETIRRARGK